MEALSPIPNPLPNDDEDVSWKVRRAAAKWCARCSHSLSSIRLTASLLCSMVAILVAVRDSAGAQPQAQGRKTLPAQSAQLLQEVSIDVLLE